jgi:hypothetical protein
MNRPQWLKLCAVSTLILTLFTTSYFAQRSSTITLQRLGTVSTGVFNGGGSEIVIHDPKTQRLFSVDLEFASIDVIDIRNPIKPQFAFRIDISPFGSQANSVAIHKRVLAVAVQAEVKTDPGKVVFFDTDGSFINEVTVGALPDMITYTPDGTKVLVANEGEPNSYNQPDSVDPIGSVSIIDLKRGVGRVNESDVTTADFSAFESVELEPSIRIFGPNATVAQDLEPEYIAVSHDSKTAWVTIQEANALGILDIEQGVFTDLVGLGFKDHSLPGNGIDGSDRDGTGNSPSIKIANWPVFGAYQPDGIAAFRSRGETFLVTANEGDTRDWPGFNEEVRVSALNLDTTAFPNGAALKTNAQIGRLTVTRATGDTDGDTDFDQIILPGGRSFSIWDSSGTQVFDSGDQFERITAAAFPDFFNANNDDNDSFDTRSDNKGPEPEGVTVGEISGRTYAFIGLERIGGVMIYEVTNPRSPVFQSYVNNRDFSGDAEEETARDLGPEGIIFIRASDSPIGEPLIVVANEVSGTTTIYKVTKGN